MIKQVMKSINFSRNFNKTQEIGLMGLQKTLFPSANEQQKYNTDTNSHPFIPSLKMIKALATQFSIDLQQHTLPTMFIKNIIIYVKENNTH